MQAGTAAAALQAGSRRGQGSAVLRLQRSWRVPLAGAELDAWREEREQAAAAQHPLFPFDSDDEDMGIGPRLSLPLPTRCASLAQGTPIMFRMLEVMMLEY